MLSKFLTSVSIHFLMFAQNNLPRGCSHRANRQIYAGDVLPAYLLSVKYIPVLFPVVPVKFPDFSVQYSSLLLFFFKLN